MKRSVVIKRLGYEASAALDNLRYIARRLFIVSGRQRDMKAPRKKVWQTSRERRPSIPAYFGQSVIAGNPAGKDACDPRQFAIPSLPRNLLGFSRQRRHDLKQVADDAVIGDLEDRSFCVLIDGHDGARAFHPDDVLDRAGDADSQI